MFKKIMFPTDFSKASNRIYFCIDTFKSIGMEEAVLVHIVDSREEKDLPELTKWAEDELEKHKERYEKENVKVKTIVRMGIPFIELNKISEEEDVSLVTITSHGKSMIEKMLLGSVAENLLYHCKKPVLIEKVDVFEDFDKEECHEVVCRSTFKHILFPTDWSECAKDVLNKIKNFNKIGTESVTVLHVMDVRHLKYFSQSKIEEFEEIDLGKLKTVEKELKKQGFKVNTILTAGTPFHEIKRAARESDITLITMGEHGKGFIKEMLIGSTAERVARHAFKPVLLLSRKEN